VEKVFDVSEERTAFIYPEDGGCVFLRNIGNLFHNTASEFSIRSLKTSDFTVRNVCLALEHWFRPVWCMA